MLSFYNPHSSRFFLIKMSVTASKTNLNETVQEKYYINVLSRIFIKIIYQVNFVILNSLPDILCVCSACKVRVGSFPII